MSLGASFERGMLRVVANIFSYWVRPTPLPVDTASMLRDRNRRVVYVLERRALSDFLVLAIVCKDLGLPSPFSGDLRATTDVRRTTVALESRRHWWSPRIDRRMPEQLVKLIGAVQAVPGADIDFMPVSVFWGRAPGKETGGYFQAFKEQWGFAGPITRLIASVIHGRRTFLYFGEPIELNNLLQLEPEPRRAVRRLISALRLSFQNARNAVLGPDIANRRKLLAEVVATRGVRSVLAAAVGSSSAARRDALKAAHGMAREIAAHVSPRMIAFAAWGFGRVWNRLYDGVDVLHGERLELAGAGVQVVYVPCHRSHMDYQLLSYVIYARGFVAPHVAAGINLNLPVIGWLLRKGGAFFLRRSFKGDALYPAVFTAYLGALMRRGYPIEYFIEGGRSRTGRLLRPKTGMLTMTVRSHLSRPDRSVIFVPVFFSYERLLEGASYVNELSGQAKEKETIGGLLRVLPALRREYGRVFVSFGEPISLDQHLDATVENWRMQSKGRPQWLGEAVDSLATRIQQHINAAVAISPIALVSLALLSRPKRAMAEDDLLCLLELYQTLARLAPYSPDAWCTDKPVRLILEQAQRMEIIAYQPSELGPVVTMTAQSAVLSNYYRNNVLHAYALPSLIACLFLNIDAMDAAEIQRLIGRIYPYVARELFLRWSEQELSAAVSQVLHAFAECGLLRKASEGLLWQRPPAGSENAVQLSILAATALPIVERYYLAIHVILTAGSAGITADGLETRCQLLATRIASLYELQAPEFFDKALYRQFLDLLRERQAVTLTDSGCLVANDLLREVSWDAQKVLSEQIRGSILQVTRTHKG